MKNKIVYDGRTFEATDIKSGQIHRATSLLSRQLEADTFTVIVRSEDKSLTDFTRGTPLYYYHNENLVFIAYIQSISRVGPNKYKLYGTSAIGRLIHQPHAGGIYTGQTAGQIIRDICGKIPVTIKSNISGIELYGYLPYANPPKRSARDNLAQVLFAIGATCRTDLSGTLHIEILWDGIAQETMRDKIYTGADVEYNSKITQVVVLEHKFSPGSEEKNLFEGTSQFGDIIIFSEPMHSLQATGFSIVESGANYAKISAGAGELVGKTYIHNTLRISRDVWQAEYPNVESVEDATLVSVVNSYDVAKRLSTYYKCLERINSSVIYRGETTGSRISTYHPFEKIGVDTCLESADIILSNTLKAKEKSLIGYIPPQYEKMVLFDRREFLTGSGTWTVPEGVSDIRVVVIGGGTSGTAGTSGGSSSLTTKYYLDTTSITTPSSSGGAGGSAGKAGTPGKVYETNIQVTSGQKISYSSGGTGQNSVFGSVSSASGGVVPGGWMDPITREWFAKPGTDGIAGGRGGAPGSSGGSVGNYAGGRGLRGESGTRYSNGSYAAVKYNSSGMGGAGASASNSGQSPSRNPYVSISYSGSTSSTGSGQCIVEIGDVGYISPGASGANGSSATTFGGAGSGGNGGGGAGAIGSVSVEVTKKPSFATSRINFKGGLNPGGSGGSGGSGKSGCIILYYGQAMKVPTGQLVDKNGKMVLDRLGRRIIV